MISSYCVSVVFPLSSLSPNPTYTVTYLSVLPAHATHRTHMTRIHFSNIRLSEHRFVKSSTLIRLKIQILRQCNPVKFDSKFQETRSVMRYHVSRKENCGVNFSLWQPREVTRHYRDLCVSCSRSLFPQNTTKKPR